MLRLRPPAKQGPSQAGRLGNGVSYVTFRLAAGHDAGSVEVAMDHPWGGTVATIPVPGNGDGKTWTELNAKVAPGITGVHAVWLRLKTKGRGSYNIDWFKFE
jgi:hypothetical protein